MILRASRNPDEPMISVTRICADGQASQSLQRGLGAQDIVKYGPSVIAIIRFKISQLTRGTAIRNECILFCCDRISAVKAEASKFTADST